MQKNMYIDSFPYKSILFNIFRKEALVQLCIDFRFTFRAKTIHLSIQRVFLVSFWFVFFETDINRFDFSTKIECRIFLCCCHPARELFSLFFQQVHTHYILLIDYFIACLLRPCSKPAIFLIRSMSLHLICVKSSRFLGKWLECSLRR